MSYLLWPLIGLACWFVSRINLIVINHLDTIIGDCNGSLLDKLCRVTYGSLGWAILLLLMGPFALIVVFASFFILITAIFAADFLSHDLWNRTAFRFCGKDEDDE